MERLPLAKLLLPLYPILCVVLAATLAGTVSSCGLEEEPAGIHARRPPVLHAVPSGPVPRIRVRLFSGPVHRVDLGSTGGARLRSGSTVLFQQDRGVAGITLRRGPAGWLVGTRSVEAMELVFEPAEGQVRVRMQEESRHVWRSYRGIIRLLPVAGDRLAVINEVPLEDYLLGVLAAEIYGSWEMEAFKAQAVAARTHAWHRALTFGAENYFDVNDDVSSQMYAGISAETDKAHRAVQATWGQVLTYPLSGRPHLFLAQYSSSCGGRVNGAEVLRYTREIPPLAGGQVCTYCDQPGNKRYRWEPLRIAKARIYFALLMTDRAYYDPLKEVRRVTVSQKTSYGRPVWLRIYGAGGRHRTIRAEDLRLILLRHVSEARGLYSMNCTIRDQGPYVVFSQGRGWGHGVGMCQWGAQGMALQGFTYEQILDQYYPQASIHRAYGPSQPR
jgi:stage II sporulation protein D